MHHCYGACAQVFKRKISVCNGIHSIGSHACKTQFVRQSLPVSLIGGACKSSRTERAQVHPVKTVGKPALVPFEHLVICQKVIRKCHRLRSLQVSVSGHYRILMLFSKIGEGAQQFVETVPDLSDVVLEVKTEIHCDLVVPAPGCMELLSHVADPLGEDSLYVHVNIFSFDAEFHFSCFYIFQDLTEGLDDKVRLLFGYDALFAQHAGMGYAACDVLFVKSLVETDGSVEFISG